MDVAITEFQVTLQASGGTPGEIDWQAAHQFKLSNRPVEFLGARMELLGVEGSHDGKPDPVWYLGDIEAVTGYSCAAYKTGMYPAEMVVLSDSNWELAGMNLTEGDKVICTMYYRI